MYRNSLRWWVFNTARFGAVLDYIRKWHMYRHTPVGSLGLRYNSKERIQGLERQLSVYW